MDQPAKGARVRKDDMLEDDGHPISAAHMAIYRHMDECRDDMITHFDSSLTTHITNSHNNLMFRNEFTAQHLEDQAAIEEIANMALGTPKSALRGGGRNDDGWDTIIRDNRKMIEDLHAKLGNGTKLKMQLDWKQTTTAIAFILFTVAKQLGLF